MRSRARGQQRVVRAGALTIGLGVVLDVPPHLLSSARLEILALVGHLVVLAGMALVLVGLVLAAVAAPRSASPRTASNDHHHNDHHHNDHRRLS